MADLILYLDHSRIMILRSIFIFGMGFANCALAQVSANYSLQVISLDGGGLHNSSANYANDGGFDGFAGLVSGAPSQDVLRIGYPGQLYEVMAFDLAAPSNHLSEGASMHMVAVQSLDDGTLNLVNTLAQWSAVGPIAAVSPGGLVTAGGVASDTVATIQARLEGRVASYSLMVINVSETKDFNRISAHYLGGTGMRLSFLGQGSGRYALDRTFSLVPPIVWVPQVTNTADLNGWLTLTNLANPAVNNFWRIRAVQ